MRTNVIGSAVVALLLGGVMISCSKKSTGSSNNPPTNNPNPNTPPTVVNWPPPTWREHWFEHNQLVNRVFYNNNIAVYFDADVNKSITWPFTFIDSVWTYTKNVYGRFGPTDSVNLLFTILHTNKYGGGHPFYYFDAGHDYRNGIDIGLGQNAWVNQTDQETDIIIHEIAHIVEGAGKSTKESPAWEIWGDSKWAEIFIYDVYDYMGRTTKKNNAYNLFNGGTENFPRAGTAWFRHWFYPVYEQHQKARVLNDFFELLKTHFPRKTHPKGMEYTRRMNLGEFVHFYSGAAKMDLSYRAQLAFGDKDRNGNNWLTQFAKAKTDFAAIQYAAVDTFYGVDLTKSATITVSKENANGASGVEGSAKIKDMDIQTKFFVAAIGDDFWIQQTLDEPAVVNSYMISSAFDAINRDPKNWELQASNDGTSWTVIETRANQLFNYRNDMRHFNAANTVPYTHYRLKVTATAGSPDLQIGEWRLFRK